jgi:hypothetical protein
VRAVDGRDDGREVAVTADTVVVKTERTEFGE